MCRLLGLMCSGCMAVCALGFRVCALGCCRVVLDGCACCAAAAGVIAVAVFGLYGAATSKFDISDNLEESGAFVYFWDTFAFVANGIVFFYAGASSVNFVIRCAAPPPLLAATHRQVHACSRRYHD